MTHRYPDSLRRQAITLFQQGKGYKSIARVLGLTRDIVRNWIAIYRSTGRTESVRTTGLLKNPAPVDVTVFKDRKVKTQSLEEREDMYRAAREAYETGTESLPVISEKYGHSYANLLSFLRKYHPESALKHTYSKQKLEFEKEIARQRTQLDRLEKKCRIQLKNALDKELFRLDQMHKGEKK